MIELQAHSTCSDGQLPARQVAAAAAEAGVTVFSLTDHDSVDGVEEARAEAASRGMEYVVGVEISCVDAELDDLHICGYHVDLARMSDVCTRAQAERVTRAEEIIDRLRSLGVDVTLEGAIAQAGDAASIGRPHIARAAGAGPDLGPFFEQYLVPGAAAFVARRWPSSQEAVELIHEAGGAAVVAHPFWDLDDPERVRRLVRGLDVDGIECYYPGHTREQTEILLSLCAERDLVATASSDFHGPTHKTFAQFGAYDTYGLGEPAVPQPR